MRSRWIKGYVRTSEVKEETAMPDYKAMGFTYVYRTPQGELWGTKLFAGKPVWCKV